MLILRHPHITSAAGARRRVAFDTKWTVDDIALWEAASSFISDHPVKLALLAIIGTFISTSCTVDDVAGRQARAVNLHDPVIVAVLAVVSVLIFTPGTVIYVAWWHALAISLHLPVRDARLTEVLIRVRTQGAVQNIAWWGT